jgi:hypothetical protein
MDLLPAQLLLAFQTVPIPRGAAAAQNAAVDGGGPPP